MNYEIDPSLNDLSGRIIGAAIEVHKSLGPGYPESVYEESLCIELTHQQVPFLRQHRVTVSYRQIEVGEGKVDLWVDDRIIVEIKAVERVLDLHGAQLLGYLKATQCLLGLLINFNCMRLYEGVQRIILGKPKTPSESPSPNL